MKQDRSRTSAEQRRQISLIAAMSENRVIGSKNRLPWHLPEDLKRFRQITLGHPVIMGRRTYESIGRLLPQRENIIITHQKNYSVLGARVVDSLEAALEYQQSSVEEIFIIGGAEIYRQALTRADKIYLTLVHQKFEGDAYFPEFNLNEFKEVSREDLPPTTSSPALSFLVYSRLSPSIT